MSAGVAQVGTPDGNINVAYVYLCGKHVYKGDTAYAQGHVVGAGQCNRCGEGSAEGVFDAECEDPRLAGWGTIEASACVALDLSPRIIWDVNRYYARLGVNPRATKREIREAYQSLNGQDSPELTAIVKFLLGDDDRRRYDLLSVGRINIDDAIMNTIRVAEARMASDLIRQGKGDLEQFQHLFLGLKDEPDEAVDEEPETDEDDVPTRSGSFNWGHYVWRSGCEDFQRLAEWQGALAAAISKREEGLKFAVGFMGHSDVSCDVTVVGYRIVAFLNDKEPVSREGSVAHWAATRVVQLSKENKIK